MLEVDKSCLDREFRLLSGGEQTKVLLSAMFIKPNGFLLIDEPTNHLDKRGRELLSAYLKTKEGFILVSHDRAFLDGCVNHILSLNRLSLEVQDGNFSSWYQNKTRRDAFEQEKNPAGFSRPEKISRDVLKTRWKRKRDCLRILKNSRSLE